MFFVDFQEISRNRISVKQVGRGLAGNPELGASEAEQAFQAVESLPDSVGL